MGEPPYCKDTLYKHLIHGAVADACHDFKTNIARDRSDTKKTNLEDIQNGLVADDCKYPTESGPEKWKDENYMFHSIFSDVDDIYPHTSNITQLKDYLQTNKNPQFTCKYTLNPKTPTYTIKYIGDPFTQMDKIITTNWNTFFETNTINLVVDASIISFVKVFDKDESSFNVNMIINREIINDPAPKVYTKPDTIKNPNIKFYYDNEENPIQYIHNETDISNIKDPLYRDKFFSKYNFILSPLKQEGGEMPTIQVDIRNKDNTKIWLNNDPHSNNSITKCLQRIKNLFKSKEYSHRIQASAHIQCKRSGDWFQALSCLDTLRKYKSDTAAIKTLQELGGKTIIVTHDRMLVWYCLVLGIDVILTWKEGRGVTLDDETDKGVNEGDEGGSSSKKHIFYFKVGELEKEEARKTRLVAQAQNLVGNVDTLIKHANNYNQWIDNYNDYVSSKKENMKKRIDSLTTVTSLSVSEVRYYNSTTTDVIQLFWRNTFVPLSKISEVEIKEFQDSSKNYTSDPTKFLKIYSKFKTLQSTYMNENSISDFYEAFKNDTNYNDIPDFFSIIPPGRRYDANVDKIKDKATNIASYLVEKLEKNEYLEMVDLLNIIRSKVKDTGFVFDYILPILLIKAPEKIRESEKARIESQRFTELNEYTDDYIAKKVIDDSAIDDNKNEYTEKGNGTKKRTKVPESTEEEKETKAKAKKISKSVIGMSRFLKRFGIDLAKQSAPAAAGAGSSMSGGGYSIEAAKFLRNLYLLQLQQTIEGIEDEDFDFEYYEKLIIVVNILLEGQAVNENTIAILYGFLPYTNLLQNEVRIAAEAVALQSIGLGDDDLHNYFTTPTITNSDAKFVMNKFNAIYKIFKYLPFEDRRRRLLQSIQDLAKDESAKNRKRSPYAMTRRKSLPKNIPNTRRRTTRRKSPPKAVVNIPV